MGEYDVAGFMPEAPRTKGPGGFFRCGRPARGVPGGRSPGEFEVDELIRLGAAHVLRLETVRLDSGGQGRVVTRKPEHDETVSPVRPGCGRDRADPVGAARPDKRDGYPLDWFVCRSVSDLTSDVEWDVGGLAATERYQEEAQERGRLPTRVPTTRWVSRWRVGCA